MSKKQNLDEMLALQAHMEEEYHFTMDTERRHELLFEPYGVSFQVYRTLTYLLRYPEGIEPSHIADDLMILRQTMTNIVDALQKRGLVERVPHPTDRRRVCIRLLDDGRELAIRLLGLEQEYITSIRSHLTAEESREYHRLLEKMHAAKVEELQKLLDKRKK